MRCLKFYKEKERWFVDLPEWTGSKDDLEMVMGADTMLDYISPENNEVWLSLSTEPFENYEFLLTFKEEIYDGGTYKLTSKNFDLDVWLCEVTKFVFNEFPKKIYLK